MLLRVASFPTKTLILLPFFCKSSNVLFVHSKRCIYLSRNYTSMTIIFNAQKQPKSLGSMARKTTHFSTTSAEALLQSSKNMGSRISRKKARRESPEMILRVKLDTCSKNGDLAEALHLYNEARANSVQLNVHHYNVLLYLCSPKSDNGEEDGEDSVRLDNGFQIFKQMRIDKVEPNEATFTNVSRLAAAKEDPKLAFDLVKQMKDHGIVPKLRSYGPALFGFCKKGMADEAYEVDSHMIDNGVLAEETELSALLRLSSEVKREGKVYEMMHRLRATVRQVSEETASTIEDWFRSKRAAEVGAEKWDVRKVKKGVLEGGGGWHGQGWLGKGTWTVMRTRMDETGVCQSCGDKLVCIDIDPEETENFAKSLAKLASEKEARTNFAKFQEWLQRHGPFDAVVDGANLGLANQHTFSFPQIMRVVNQLRQISPTKKFPLVVLHQSRVSGGPAQHPNNKKLLETWKRAGALYSTPQGSNDDWYWLYAAVSSKCLLVTNDEMRDHLFNLLGNSFFPRWKEKHQVRIKPSSNGLILHMPPPYSLVIQESERGSWHIPTVTGDDLETPRQWVCATRM
ncbi:proteinaceous RNase P 1, chloroplastic/mitochondrial [Sesamum indicum]|uniref:ribonuclease P n=1 Tax=Sesamum indicum TaxID=4182 RepID=A0A6I9T2J2_SESIN|nr:proteinaceous RNase P 1, chloroplastic/mitochondrial [Sesamum indicum]